MTATVDAEKDDIADRVGAARSETMPRLSPLLGLGPALLVVALTATRAHGRPLWLDESYTLAATRDLGTAFEAARGSMGLYYAFAWVWGHVSDSAVGLRLPSFLAAGAAVYLFARLVARQHGVAVARWASLGVAVSYPAIAYGQEARSYAFVGLATVAAWSTLDRGLADADDDAAWRWHRLCCIALPLLHGLGATQLVAQGAVLIVAGVRGRALRRAWTGVGLGLATVAAALAVGSGQSGDWLPPLSVDAARALVVALTVPLGEVGLVVAAVVLVATAVLLRRSTATAAGLDRFRVLMPIAWGPAAVTAVLAVSVVRPSYLARYSAAAAFGLVLTAAVAAVGVDRRRGAPTTGRAVPLAALTLVVALGAGGLVAATAEGPEWDDAAAIVATSAQTGDGIVFPTADAQLPFDAEWRTGDRPVTPHVVGSPHPLGAVRRSLATRTARELVQDLDGETRLWVVEQDYQHVPNPDLLDDPEIRSRYRVAETWALSGGITITLLELRR